KCLIEKPAIRIENLADTSEVHIPENGNEAQLAQHRLKILNRSRAAKHACGNADDPRSFVNVFFETTIEDMLEQTGKAVVVLRADDDDRVGSFHRIAKARVLYRFAGVIDWNFKLSDIDQLRNHTAPPPELADNEVGSMCAHPAFTCSPQNNGYEERTDFIAAHS